MKEGGAILSKIAKTLSDKIKVGVSTGELDRASRALFLYYKVEPAFLGHQGFPASICTSVNQMVVHGVPSPYQLKDGDVLSVDLGLKYNGFYLDMAFSRIVGDKKLANPLAEKLVKAARKALELAVKAAKPGVALGDIGFLVEDYVKKQGFNVVRNLCGHGIGKELHEDPQILNYGNPGEGEALKEGMVICFEPMITMGDWHIQKSADGFGYETKDGSLAVHFEQTIAITKKGSQILTKL